MANFIKDRWNKDNFWNLIFGIIMFCAWTSGLVVPQPLGGIIFWILLLTAIALVKFNSPVSFNNDKKEFTTRNGIIRRKVRSAFVIMIILSFMLGGILSMTITGVQNIADSFLTQILIALFAALIPTLYCILRNFPISVYFHKNAWIGFDTMSSSDHKITRHKESLLSTNQLINNPINNWYSGNIYRRK